MRRGLVILLSFLFSSPVIADPPDPVVSSAPASTAQCDLIMAGLSKFDSRLADVFKFVSTIDPDVLSLKKIPGWQDIEDFKSAIQKIKDAKADLKTSGRLDELMQWSDKALADYPLDPASMKIKDAVAGAKQNEVYQPTEYDLKRIYEDLIYQYDKEVPKYLRISMKHLPYDVRKFTLIPKANEVLKNQRVLFEKYISTTGFPDMQSYENAVSKSGPVAQKLLNMLKHGDFEFAMNRPEGARWWVSKVGFQNTTVVAQKGEGYLSVRNSAEAGAIFQKLSDYMKLDTELKPEYGYLRPAPDAGFKQSQSAAGYGSDTYVFKPEALKHRTTFTRGDSFGLPHPSDPEAPKPETWESFMVPFNYRTLAIPGMLAKAEKENIAFEMSDITNGSLPPSIVPPPEPKYPQRPTTGQPEPPPQPQPPPMPEMVGKPDPPPYPQPSPIAPVFPKQPIPTGDIDADAKSQQDFRKAMDDFYESPEYVKYSNDINVYLQHYQTTPEYQTYEKAMQTYISSYYKSKPYLDWFTLWQKIQSDYQKSPSYLAYTKALSDWEQAWINGPIYQKYLADVKAYEVSAPYLDYLDKAKKYRAQQMEALYGKNSLLRKFQDSATFGYIELQYWGPVDFDDVSIFEFHGNPPSGEFLNELKSHHVIIRDGRVQPAVIWDESKG